MNPLKFVTAGTVASVVAIGLLVTITLPIAATANGLGSAAGALAIDPSQEATEDIPPELIGHYATAAEQCAGLPWTVIAGIAKIESDHGRIFGGTLQQDGRILPEIIGIALNGHNNTMAIVDTDRGTYDRDIIWDRAVGPFQFIPTSWRLFGVDGNNDGQRDPHNIHDAVPAAVAHLCPTGTLTDIERAVFSYNRSQAYVDNVMSWSQRYTGTVSRIATGGYASPIPGLTPALAMRPHHDYPAWDVGLPSGTPTYAMVNGTVDAINASNAIYNPATGTGRCGNTIIITGADNATYTYCHLTSVLVAAGQNVTAGQTIGATGGRPGTPGAGNTTGAHLHLSIRRNGRSVCPQPILLAITQGQPIDPATSPSTGCISIRGIAQNPINWTAWLTNVNP